MNDELRERRKRTWLLYIVRGVSFTATMERLADEFDCAEGTIKADISRMDDWLPKLDPEDLSDGISEVREARENRQRLQQMALQARQDNDPERELKIRRQIDQSIEKFVTAKQSLGMLPEEPDKQELTGEDGSPLMILETDSDNGDSE